MSTLSPCYGQYGSYATCARCMVDIACADQGSTNPFTKKYSQSEAALRLLLSQQYDRNDVVRIISHIFKLKFARAKRIVQDVIADAQQHLSYESGRFLSFLHPEPCCPLAVLGDARRNPKFGELTELIIPKDGHYILKWISKTPTGTEMLDPIIKDNVTCWRFPFLDRNIYYLVVK